MKSPFYIFGAGGHGKCVIEAARAAGNPPDAVIDDSPHVSELLGVPAIRPQDVDFKSGFRFVIAIGDCGTRREKFEMLRRFGGEPKTVIHPRAYVSESAQIGVGSVVLAQSSIDPSVIIGENVLVNLGAVIGHDCIVESHAHVSGNVGLSGGTHVGEGAWVGINSCTVQFSKIGAWSVIGAGSVVCRDIPPRVIAKGNPAHRNIRSIMA
jgi:sugar O-acyltransferase (sialic acid O-acetyltransferase NeuD family)